jgi:hypothetical protein
VLLTLGGHNKTTAFRGAAINRLDDVDQLVDIQSQGKEPVKTKKKYTSCLLSIAQLLQVMGRSGL